MPITNSKLTTTKKAHRFSTLLFTGQTHTEQPSIVDREMCTPLYFHDVAQNLN